MAQAEVKEIFNCSPDQFFSILTDYEKYPEFLSEVKNCKILKKAKSKVLVEFEVSVFKTFTYRLWMQEQKNLLSWELESGDVFKTSLGSWTLKEVEKGKTEAFYQVEASFSLFVPGFMTKALMSVNLPTMVASYHKRVKDLYDK